MNLSRLFAASACVCVSAAPACGSDEAVGRTPSTDAGTGGLSNAGGAAATGGAVVGTAGSPAAGGSGSGGRGAGGGSGGSGTNTGGVASGGTSSDAGTDGSSTGSTSGTGGSAGSVSAWSCQQANTACLCVEDTASSDDCTLPKAKCCFTFTGASGVANCQCWDQDPAGQGCTTLIGGLRGTAVTTCPPP